MSSDGAPVGGSREGTEAVPDDVEPVGGKGEERLSQPGEGSVFISYRVTPDEPIAAALKELLESCLTPKPSVFVSGLGGIVPSESSSKAQIQRAAQKADAFIAIITKSSRQREWIFFEAGAAWVRNLLYAPLLAGVDFEGLPNSINSYQAVEYAKEEKVLELLREVAARAKCQVRQRAFRTRYAVFKGAVATALGERLPSDDDERKHDVEYAIDLIFEGTPAAEAKLDKFAPDDPKLLSYVKLLRIRFDEKLSSHQKLEKLQGNSELRELAAYAYHCALYESAPHRSLEYACQALEALRSPDTNPYYYAESLGIALTHLKSFGREEEGLTLLRQALVDSRRFVRSNAAIRLAQHLSNAPKLMRAALAAFAASEHADGGTLVAAARILHESGPIPLTVYIAHLADTQEKSAIAQLYLGLAYSAAGFKSFAYSKYKSAAAGKVSVAKANLAQLFATGPVAGAGLELLQEHEGPFDSSLPGYPHSTRAELEEAVHTEREEIQVIIEAGRASFAILAQVVDANVRATAPVRVQVGVYSSKQGTKHEVKPGSAGLVLSIEAASVTICQESVALPGLLFMYHLISDMPGIIVPRSPKRYTMYWFGVSDAPESEDFELVSESSKSTPIGALPPGPGPKP